MTNELTPAQKVSTEIVRADRRPQLPIDAHATMCAALTAEIRRIFKKRQRMTDLKKQIRETDATSEKRDAALIKFLVERGPLPDDIALVELMLSTWATKDQFRVLAGMVASSFANSARLEKDFWLNSVWMTLTCEHIENGELVGGVPVSDTVLALAVTRLCRTAKFVPAPAEFYEAVCTERENLEGLLNGTSENSLVRLATKKPPPVSVSFTNEEIEELEEGYTAYDESRTTRGLADGDFKSELTTASRKDAIIERMVQWREEQVQWRAEARARRAAEMASDGVSGEE
jgi:hypothetical protein